MDSPVRAAPARTCGGLPSGSSEDRARSVAKSSGARPLSRRGSESAGERPPARDGGAHRRLLSHAGRPNMAAQARVGATPEIGLTGSSMNGFQADHAPFEARCAAGAPFRHRTQRGECRILPRSPPQPARPHPLRRRRGLAASRRGCGSASRCGAARPRGAARLGLAARVGAARPRGAGAARLGLAVRVRRGSASRCGAARPRGAGPPVGVSPRRMHGLTHERQGP